MSGCYTFNDSCIDNGRTCVWGFGHYAYPCEKQAEPEVNMLLRPEHLREASDEHEPCRNPTTQVWPIPLALSCHVTLTLSLVVHVSNRLSAWVSPFEHDSVVFSVWKNRVRALKRQSCTTTEIRLPEIRWTRWTCPANYENVRRRPPRSPDKMSSKEKGQVQKKMAPDS